MSNFCIIPWISLTSDNQGLVRPCCRFAEADKQVEFKTENLKDMSYEEIWNGETFQRLRQAFLDDKRPAECSSCWNEEAAGLQSYRKTYNDSYIHKLPKEAYSTTKANPPIVLDLKLSNICNFKCRMCNGFYSSLIVKEEKQLGINEWEDEQYYISDKILGTENEKWFFEEVIPNLAQIEFTGGEPMFSPEGKKIISMIASTEYAKDIILLITTNGSVYSDSIANQFKKFKQVKILISLDDIGNRLEYQRHGAIWEDISKNILKYKDIENVNLSLHPTINNYNIWDIQDYFYWAEKHNLSITINVLFGPDHLCIKQLPMKLKEMVYEKHKHISQLKESLNFMMEKVNINDEENHIKFFLKETRRLDEIRKESFTKVFPIWSELVKDVLLSTSK